MHVNLRRLHSSSGAATSRSRALTLARACTSPAYSAAILFAALGDHPWRKLHGAADEPDVPRVRSWRDGPYVAVPELLRTTGRSGARGYVPPARDDSDAREQVRAARDRRAAEHQTAIAEVLAAPPGSPLSDRAARVAFEALLAAVRANSVNSRRTAVRDGLGCSLFHVGTATGVLTAPSWRVFTPGRVAIFHLPGVTVGVPAPLTVIDERDSPCIALAGAE
jgi:hypothetical protein